MNKTRLEAFSDGVIAIIITIMVLELKVPDGHSWHALRETAPTLVSYIMSFLFVGVYWGNHHHLLHVAKSSRWTIMLANLNLLFWLSLVPFATNWMGEEKFAPFTVATYAALLNLCGVSYSVLQHVIAHHQRGDTTLELIMKKQAIKGYASLVLYTAAIPLAYVHPAISVVTFFAVAFYWLIPDQNIERLLADQD